MPVALVDASHHVCHVGALCVAGTLAVGELDHRRVAGEPPPLFLVIDRWGPLIRGSRLSVTPIQKASSNLQIVMLSCEFCNSKYVDPNGVIQILLDS